MAGLDVILDQVDSLADRFLRRTSGQDPTAQGFDKPGRFTLGGLFSLLSLGTKDWLDVGPDQLDPSTLDAPPLAAAFARAHSSVTIDEAKEAVYLLRTGAVETDVLSALAPIMGFAHHVPTDLFGDLLSGGPGHGPPHPPDARKRPGKAVALLDTPIRSQALRAEEVPRDVVLDAVKTDFSGDPPRRPAALLADLRDGRIDGAVLPRTLGVLLDRAAPRDAANTLRALIAPENRTVRLAIVIYARTQGVDIDEADLDALYHAIDPDDPNLALLLNRGLERLLSQYGTAAGAVAVLRRLTPDRSASSVSA